MKIVIGFRLRFFFTHSFYLLHILTEFYDNWVIIKFRRTPYGGERMRLRRGGTGASFSL